ncbi:tRNA pseudouridine(55) synthase TruB [Candidatus Peribacteria bacterium]|nr:MAG: tRNA pseudouridine(55) synthase TruB [Candidatus Peribacteria bacterium]
MRHGFILIDKPVGPTSHDIVQTVRNVLHESKAGHLGTLDPAASGLMVVAVGAKALKVIEFFNHLTKEYEATVTFGAVSSTYDREGSIEKYPIKPGVPEPDHIAVRRMIEERFVGRISQTPPAHSAVHVDGQRAYDLARQGIEVQMPKREVEISACDIVSYTYPSLVLRVACGSGTYIRSLAHDLGQLLRVGGYLEALRRTKVGNWDVKQAVKPDAAVWSDVIPLKDILKDFVSVELDTEQAAAISLGKKIPLIIQPNTVAWSEGLPIAILVPSSDNPETAHARKVL